MHSLEKSAAPVAEEEALEIGSEQE